VSNQNFQTFDDKLCEQNSWYESSDTWIEVARQALAIRKGEPSFHFPRVVKLIHSKEAIHRLHEHWSKLAGGMTQSHEAGNVCSTILDAISAPLSGDRDWFEIARAASCYGRASFRENPYVKLHGLFEPKLQFLEVSLTDDDFDSNPTPQTSVEFSSVVDAVERSRTIMNLQENWDGEGAQGYSVRTWQRATGFLLKQAAYARDHRYSVGVPRVAPADHGSIDIHWMNEEKELLVNVPSDSAELGTYYGQNQTGDTISGVLNTNASRPDLVVWLMQSK
jgi:hypothetical protein